MMFKTFNSDIDKWTAKIGIFGKSFNELGTAVDNAIKSVINNIDNFDEDVSFWENLKNNLFSQKDIDKDWIKNSLGQIISKENIDSYIKELDLDFAKKKLQEIFDWQEDINNGETTWNKYFDTCKGGNEYLINVIKNTDDLSKLTGEDLVKANQAAREAAIAHNTALQQQTLSTKAAEIGMKALSLAGNMLAMWLVSKAVSGLYELSQVSENVAQKAQDMSRSFSSAKSDIEGYKKQITDLYQTINSNDSSLEDVTNARKNLMAVQDELIEKFGTEKDTINLVTEAISGQTSALDKLTERQWQEAKNQFNNAGFWNGIGNFFGGYSDNIDRMENEYANRTVKIDLSKFYGLTNVTSEEYLKFKDLLEKDFSAAFSIDEKGNSFAELSGNATELYEKLLDIQGLSGQFDFSDSFSKHLRTLTADTKDAADKYADFYHQFVLEEKIFKDADYEESFNQINNAYKEYEKASTSGDQTAIDKATENFSHVLTRATEGLSDKSVIDYFNNMYPALQTVVDKWEFKAKILPDIDISGLQGKTENDVWSLYQNGSKSSNPFLQKALDVQTGKSALDSLIDKAKEYGICTGDSAEEVQKLIDLLIELRIVQKTSSAPDSQPSFVQTLSSVQALSKGLEQLDTIYADIQNDADFDWSSVLNNSSFSEAFGNLGPSYENFIKTISSSPSDIGQCQQASNELTAAYINQSGVLKNLTEESRDAAVAFLEQSGVSNAAAVIDRMLAVEREKAAYATGALAGANYQEIYSMYEEASAGSVASQALAQYALSKLNTSGINFNESANIGEIISLANAAGASTESLARLAQAKSIIAGVENGTAGGKQFLDNGMYEEALNVIKELESGTYDFQFKMLNPDDFKYTGGLKSFTAAEKEAKNATQATTDALQSQTDALEKQKSALEDTKNQMDELKDAVAWFYDGKSSELDKQIDKLNEENEALEKQKENLDGILSVIDRVYEAEIGRIQDKISALDEANEEKEREIALEKAQAALAEARNRKSIMVYEKGKGFVYRADEGAVREAEENLSALQEEASLEAARSALQEQIDLLETYRSMWAQIPDARQKAMEELAASRMFGPGWQDAILNSDEGTINSFQNNYTGIQSGIAANDSQISMLEAEKQHIEELKSLWTDAVNQYKYGQYEAQLSSFFGSDYEYQLLNNSSAWRQQFINEYSTVCAQIDELSARIADPAALENLNTLTESLGQLEASRQTLIEAVDNTLTETDAAITDSEEKLAPLKETVDYLVDAVSMLQGAMTNLLAKMAELDTVSLEHVMSLLGFGMDTEAESLFGAVNRVLQTLTGEEGLAAKLSSLNEMPMDLLIGEFSGEEESLLTAIMDVANAIYLEDDENCLIFRINSIANTVGNIRQVSDAFVLLALLVRTCFDEVERLDKRIQSMQDKHVYIYTHHIDLYGYSTGSAFTSGPYAAETGPAFSRGNWGLPQDRPHSLVAELGPELIVRDGIYRTVSTPQLVDLKKGDIIFNHEQTRAILRYGKSSNIRRLGREGSLKTQGVLSHNAFSEGSASHVIPQELYGQMLPAYRPQSFEWNRFVNENVSHAATTLQFHGDLSFPNIHSGEDAKKLISELSVLSSRALQHASKRQ